MCCSHPLPVEQRVQRGVPVCCSHNCVVFFETTSDPNSDPNSRPSFPKMSADAHAFASQLLSDVKYSSDGTVIYSQALRYLAEYNVKFVGPSGYVLDDASIHKLIVRNELSKRADRETRAVGLTDLKRIEGDAYVLRVARNAGLDSPTSIEDLYEML